MYPDGTTIHSEAVSALRNFARRNETTIPVVMLAAFSIVLSRWSGANDVLIAIIHFGRHRPETWPLIGCLIQAWVLRVGLEGAPSFVDVVRQIHQTTAEAQPRLDTPFLLTKQLLAQGADEQPLLHITFNYVPSRAFMKQNAWTRDLSISVFPMPVEAPASLDEGRGEKLIFTVFEAPDSLRTTLRYSSSRFSSATIDRFWDHFNRLLGCAITDGEDSTDGTH